MTGRRGPPQRALLADAWPEPDRRAWTAAIAPGDVLGGPGAGSTWAKATRTGIANSYGRWLFWLARDGRLNAEINPADRVTPEAIAQYIADLQTHAASSSIAIYLAFLSSAMVAMVPEVDWEWLKRVAARLSRRSKPARNKRPLVVPIEELFAFGLLLMENAEASCGVEPWRRAVDYRNGLMIALLAARPLRRRNFCSMRVGQHLVQRSSAYALTFVAGETKTGKMLDLPFPGPLVPYLERYLSHFRLHLCAMAVAHPRPADFRAAQDQLWVSKTGSPLSGDTFYKELRKLTAAQFGHPINPHLFRDCAATSIAIEDPEWVAVTRIILGHSTPRTSERYYNHSRAVQAATRYQTTLARLREAKKRPGRTGRGPTATIE